MVKNIRRMSWGYRTGLIAMLTLVFSVLLYQGWRQVQEAQAAVAVQTQWALLGTGTTSTLPAMSLAKGTGSNRLLVVKVVADYSTAITTFAPTVSYGGQTLTRITSTDTSSRQKVWFGYLKEAQIAAATSTSFAVNWGSTPQSGCGLSAAMYANVDQGTPVSGSRAVSSDTAATTPTSGTVAVTGGGWAVYGSSVNLNTATTTTPAGYTKHFDTANSTLYQDSVGSKQISATGTENPRPVWGSQRYAFAVVGLNPASTTLGNGVAGATATVAPGAAAQKLDGFSLATGTAGTSDAVTGLTVTTTGQAAIASMQIWNEAGTTQYFATVNNPGSDTWNFSGGTAIPVTNAAANYKVLVTYKTRAGGAPAGNTASTARVTAISSGNLLSGSDSADTTITLGNTHNPSTWGSNTAGNGQITLNWTLGTPGQSVVVIRYSANTDSTKPADGTSYGVGNSFGSGGTVRFVGAGTTLTDSVGVVNGTTYYYKIFEYDSFTNYYNATDVWSAGLTPTNPDAVAPTVDAGFAAATPSKTAAVPITFFTATDNVGGSGVSGYLITTTSTPPSAGAAGWSATAPASFTVAGDGSYTLYPWAKDGGGNVSPLYGSPVTVLVDSSAPSVSAFGVNTPAASRNIPIASFTGADTGSGVAGYLVTTSSAQPAAGAAGWSATAPASFTVAGDGSYTLYPWVKDAAGNVSALSGSPRTVLVDSAAPTGLAPVAPLDTATDLPLGVSLQCTSATDAGSGGVSYWFQITDGAGYNVNSGWIAGTSFAPAGLAYGTTYTWSVKAKDAVGNQTALTAPSTFTTGAACVRNNPTVTLLTGTGGVASTISSDGGTAVYNLKLINNDFGGCGSTQFNLAVADSDLNNVFDPPALGAASVTLAPGANITTSVTVKATAGAISGVGKTWASTAADAYHASMTTGKVQTTLNVVGCTPHTPLLIVGPDSGYLNKGGSFTYTVTVNNTDTGTGCAPATYNLSVASDSNLADFNASSFSTPSLVLNAGEIGSATLTVSAKMSAPKNALNTTAIAAAAAGHAAPANKTVTSRVGNPMLHNSDNTGSTKWSSLGGWGVPGGRYGEFVCTTCHIEGGTDTANIKRTRQSVTAPDPSKGQLPGAGQSVVLNRFEAASPAQGSLGWDAGATPRSGSSKICEICHTYDASRVNGVNARPYATGAALGSHFGSDGKDCVRCHKHNKGFGVAGLTCTACHGTDTGSITPANRYLVAPPSNTAGLSGTPTGVGQVSNDPRVGAHQTHLRLFNGFTNYSTVDFRCQNCHGPLPTDFSHGNVAGSSVPVFQGLATRGGMSASFNSANLTCSNTYCHNPAGSGILLATNAGSQVFPSWTSARYVSSGAKSVANCSVCHKVPGVAGFEPASTHAGMNTDTQDCSGCHGHNGDASGVSGKRHMDGIKFGAGNCDSCHSYDTVAGSWGKTNFGGTAAQEGIGAHAKHIDYIKARWGGLILSPTTDRFGLGTAAAVCGVCHTNIATNHSMGDATQPRSISFGESTTRAFGGNPVYNGVSNTSSSVNPKTCSNIDCHYKQTPVWSSF